MAQLNFMIIIRRPIKLEPTHGEIFKSEKNSSLEMKRFDMLFAKKAMFKLYCQSHTFTEKQTGSLRERGGGTGHFAARFTGPPRLSGTHTKCGHPRTLEVDLTWEMSSDGPL